MVDGVCGCRCDLGCGLVVFVCYILCMNMFDDFLFGKIIVYVDCYDFVLLFLILCVVKCVEIGVMVLLLFCGVDVWNVYEFLWLDVCGKLMVVLVEICVLVSLLNIIELKLFKFYFNGFLQECMVDMFILIVMLECDLFVVVGVVVKVEFSVFLLVVYFVCDLDGVLFDDQVLDIDDYGLFKVDYLCVYVGEVIEELLVLDLLCFNCLVIGQLDWGSVQIYYCGWLIDCEGLLCYFVLFCIYNEFYE